MRSSVVEKLCRMPVVFVERRDISMVALFEQSGYTTEKSELTEKDIEDYLKAHPDLVTYWLGHSDRPCFPAWRLEQPGEGGKDTWRVHYYDVGMSRILRLFKNRPRVRVFPNEFAAVAFYVMREIEELLAMSSTRP